MLEAGADADVAGFVDHRLDAQRPAVLEVLLDAAVLGAKLEPDLAAGGEDAAAEGRKRGRDHCHPAVEEGLNVGRAEAVADRLQPRWVVTAGKAVLSARNVVPARSACRFAHSCPFNHTFSGYGKWVQILMKPGPNSGS